MHWSLIRTAVGGIAQAAAAITTFLAVGVALWLGLREGRRSLQARYDDARPVLIIKSEPQSIPVHQGSDWYLDWEAGPPVITVYNTGDGPALNVRSVIYGPEAIAATDATGTWQYLVGVKAEEEREKRWYHWTVDAVSQREEKELQYALASRFSPKVFSQAKKFIESKDHKQKYTFNAPKQPLESPNVSKEPWCICRVTMTYKDIFHRKHASIYDLILWQGWQVVALIDDVISDLGDLAG
jgi:hypothetical protein